MLSRDIYQSKDNTVYRDRKQDLHICRDLHTYMLYILIQTGVCHILHSFLACKIPLLLCQDFFLLLLKICIKLIRITFLHKVLGNVQIISRYLTVQWWAQAGIFWEEMNWKISKNVLNWPYIVISTKYLLFCYYFSMYIEKEYVNIPLLLLILSCLLFMFYIQKCKVNVTFSVITIYMVNKFCHCIK